MSIRNILDQYPAVEPVPTFAESIPQADSHSYDPNPPEGHYKPESQEPTDMPNKSKSTQPTPNQATSPAPDNPSSSQGLKLPHNIDEILEKRNAFRSALKAYIQQYQDWVNNIENALNLECQQGKDHEKKDKIKIFQDSYQTEIAKFRRQLDEFSFLADTAPGVAIMGRASHGKTTFIQSWFNPLVELGYKLLDDVIKNNDILVNYVNQVEQPTNVANELFHQCAATKWLPVGINDCTGALARLTQNFDQGEENLFDILRIDDDYMTNQIEEWVNEYVKAKPNNGGQQDQALDEKIDKLENASLEATKLSTLPNRFYLDKNDHSFKVCSFPYGNDSSSYTIKKGPDRKCSLQGGSSSKPTMYDLQFNSQWVRIPYPRKSDDNTLLPIDKVLEVCDIIDTPGSKAEDKNENDPHKRIQGRKNSIIFEHGAKNIDVVMLSISALRMITDANWETTVKDQIGKHWKERVNGNPKQRLIVVFNSATKIIESGFDDSFKTFIDNVINDGPFSAFFNSDPTPVFVFNDLNIKNDPRLTLFNGTNRDEAFDHIKNKSKALNGDSDIINFMNQLDTQQINDNLKDSILRGLCAFFDPNDRGFKLLSETVIEYTTKGEPAKQHCIERVQKLQSFIIGDFKDFKIAMSQGKVDQATLNAVKQNADALYQNLTASNGNNPSKRYTHHPIDAQNSNLIPDLIDNWGQNNDDRDRFIGQLVKGFLKQVLGYEEPQANKAQGKKPQHVDYDSLFKHYTQYLANDSACKAISGQVTSELVREQLLRVAWQRCIILTGFYANSNFDPNTKATVIIQSSPQQDKSAASIALQKAVSTYLNDDQLPPQAVGHDITKAQNALIKAIDPNEGNSQDSADSKPSEPSPRSDIEENKHAVTESQARVRGFDSVME